jgi:hypothetical protein
MYSLQESPKRLIRAFAFFITRHGRGAVSVLFILVFLAGLFGFIKAPSSHAKTVCQLKLT